MTKSVYAHCALPGSTELFNAAGNAARVTYTLEQLKQMSSKEINKIANEIMFNGTEPPWMIFHPALNINDSLSMQTRAIMHNSSVYLDSLNLIVNGYERVDVWVDSELIGLLQTTPQQQTIAAILSLQGQKSEWR
ncbi:hypothetical protein [Paenibacillus sp. 481]|uniref:hypothetical protein n=1 Tax=Paenibacillus sp. 481 TaxID=2835869 RepID=UPI001E646415|nr:hypothetical protein [Paenibacillus sp. 481]UHA74426.1 hypothetical protein KIK04_04780 [Paenibacillus sp. 481]